MSQSQRPRYEDDDWSTPLHKRVGLLTLEEAGDYRATCRRCRDTFPKRGCRLPPPHIYPYIEEARLMQAKECPDEDFWFQTEPGCCYRVLRCALATAIQENDIAAALFLLDVIPLSVDEIYYVSTLEMARALHAAGVDFTPHIFLTFDMLPTEALPAVEEILNLQGIDVNIVDDIGRTMLLSAVDSADIERVRFVIGLNPDMTKRYYGRTIIEHAENEATGHIGAAAHFSQDPQRSAEFLQKSAAMTAIANLLRAHENK